MQWKNLNIVFFLVPNWLGGKKLYLVFFFISKSREPINFINHTLQPPLPDGRRTVISHNQLFSSQGKFLK